MDAMKYLKYNVKLLQFAGGQYKAKHPAIIPWKFINSFSLCFFLLSSFADAIRNKHLGFNAIAINCVNIGCGLMVIARTHYFYLFQNESEQLVNNMNNLFKYTTETGLGEKCMDGYIKFTVRLTVCFLIVTLLFAESFAVAQLILGVTEDRKLPYPMWYPYDWKGTPKYEITCTQQVISHIMLVVLQIGGDMFYASSLLLTVGQFELLGWELQNIVYTSLVQCGVEKEQVINFKKVLIDDESSDIWKTRPEDSFVNIYEIIESKEFTDCLVNKFRRIVKFHQKLILFCNDLESFFSPLLLMYTLIIMLTFLFTLYFIVTSTDKSVRIIFAGYVIMIPADILVTCFIGQLLTSQTEQVLGDLYNVPWYLCSKDFKSRFLILQLGVGQPVSLTIGKFAKLTLNTSLWILRTAFSYTAVLRQMTK